MFGAKMKWWNGGISSSSSSSASSLLLLSRFIPSRHFSTKLFVGGLSNDTNETILRDAFDRHGEIIEVKVICDRVSGRSQRYGFVQFTSENAASKALEEMNDKLLDGRKIRVHYALKR